MKKKSLRGVCKAAAVLMAGAILAGCGSKQEAASEEGEVLNIHTSGNELYERVVQLYPDYEDLGDGKGKIGDVEVNWIITPNDGNAYQTKLDENLGQLEETDKDERIDLFTIEADYARKYAQTAPLMTMEEVGITQEDMSSQYDYTKEIVKNTDGKICASAWQATPGFFLYRRSIAKDVFGTDDPARVQELLSTWDKFDEAAGALNAKGYMMFSAYTDSYWPFNANKSQPWVDEALTIRLDEHVMAWIDQTKEYTDKGYNNKKVEISDITKDFVKEAKVFGAFAAPWYMDYVTFSCLDNQDEPMEPGNGSYGDWAACTGPEEYYWGGTWLCVPQGCDNVAQVRDIIYALTCDQDTMKQLTMENGEFVNNKEVMDEVAADKSYECAFLGGQNHISFLAAAADSIDMSNTTMYDQGVGDACKSAFRDYFDGFVSKEEATERFYQFAITTYPELKAPEK